MPGFHATPAQLGETLIRVADDGYTSLNGPVVEGLGPHGRAAQRFFLITLTSWCGFADDVAVGCIECADVVEGGDAGPWSTLVFFSQSRCGTNDFGKNAQRATVWLDALERALETAPIRSMAVE
jgi:hypothetical protein